jgi:uncharacterized protein (DUF983 family)
MECCVSCHRRHAVGASEGVHCSDAAAFSEEFMSEPAQPNPRPSQLHARSLPGVCDPKPELRDLPSGGSARRNKLLKRGLLLRCPYCGQGHIIKYPFWIKDCCPRCGYRFEPEPGYLVGGYAINLVGVEIVAVAIIVIILLRTNLSLYQQEAIGIGFAILLPILFFPWSRTLWMAFDLTLQGDAHLEQERKLGN